MKKVLTIFLLTILFTVLIFIFHSKIHWLKSEDEISQKNKNELIMLANKSLLTNDVPISSIIIYKNKIIGRGFNTIYADTNAGGHAEINAISDALKNLGIDKFDLLDRDSLYLISTFELCSMCLGAIQMYNIQNVFFMKEKKLMSNLSHNIKTVKYYLTRKTLSPASLQDSLFSLHPDYHKQLEK